MRWLFAVFLVTCAAGCRRTPEPRLPEPRLSEPLPAAEAPEASAAGAEAPAPTASSPAIEPAAAPPAAAGGDRAPGIAPDPAPAEPDDDAIYTWTDEDGVTQFGGANEIPEERRARARKVGGGVTVIEAGPLDLPPPPAQPLVSGAPADDGSPAPTPAPAAAPARGERPALDAQGLPIPGTMDETAHLRAVRQATGVALDAAAVERQYQQQLRDMNCREKDGAIVCE